MTVKALAEPTDDDLERIAHCKDAIFSTNPFASTAANDDADFFHRRSKNAAAYDTLIVACPDEGTETERATVHGVIGISLPGYAVGHGPKGAAPRLARPNFSEERMEWLQNTMGPRWDAFTTKNFGSPEMKDKMYIEYLGVADESHNKGFGSALVQEVIRRADEEGVQVVLATHSERLVNFYKRHGFGVLGSEEWDIPGKGIWTLYGMGRPAQKQLAA